MKLQADSVSYVPCVCSLKAKGYPEMPPRPTYLLVIRFKCVLESHVVARVFNGKVYVCVYLLIICNFRYGNDTCDCLKNMHREHTD